MTEPTPPFLLIPPKLDANACVPAENMLKSDVPLQTKFVNPPPAGFTPWLGPGPQVMSRAPTAPWLPQENDQLPNLPDSMLEETNIPELQNYAITKPANLMVPPEQPVQAEDDSSEEDSWEFKGASRKYEDLGVSRETYSDGAREYISSGYTLRKPFQEKKIDKEWAGKFAEDFTIAEASKKSEIWNLGADDTPDFGGDGTLFSGGGDLLGTKAESEYGGKITSKGIEAVAGAEAEAYFAKGEIESDSSKIASGKASGSVLSAKAKAEAEVVLTAEQATLGGELGGELNLAEGKIEGEFCVTPKRVTDTVLGGYNYITGSNVKSISDDWDVGICVNAGASVQAGASAKAKGRAGYEKGKLRAEFEAKAALGLGGGAKIGGGFTGLYKVPSLLSRGYNKVKSLWPFD